MTEEEIRELHFNQMMEQMIRRQSEVAIDAPDIDQVDNELTGETKQTEVKRLLLPPSAPTLGSGVDHLRPPLERLPTIGLDGKNSTWDLTG